MKEYERIIGLEHRAEIEKRFAGNQEQGWN